MTTQGKPSVEAFDIKAPSCPRCGSAVPQDGCDHPWHRLSSTLGHAGFQHRGTHGWLIHDGHPLHQHSPGGAHIRWATDDEIERMAREHRCPDRGYCHGSSIAAGSTVCEPGKCLRVHTSSPLSGVFPGDRWPDDVLAANGIAKPDGTPLVLAIRKTGDLSLALTNAMGSRDGWPAIAAYLDKAVDLAGEILTLASQARENVPGDGRIEGTEDEGKEPQ